MIAVVRKDDAAVGPSVGRLGEDHANHMKYSTRINSVKAKHKPKIWWVYERVAYLSYKRNHQLLNHAYFTIT